MSSIVNKYFHNPFTESYKITNETWHFVAFVFNSREDLGTFVVDDTWGYNGPLNEFETDFPDPSIDPNDPSGAAAGAANANANPNPTPQVDPPRDHKGAFFKIKDGEWLMTATSGNLRIGANKFQPDQDYKGRMSCLQVFNKALTLAQIHHLKDCDLASEYQKPICHDGYSYIKGRCYKVPSIAFLQTT